MHHAKLTSPRVTSRSSWVIKGVLPSARTPSRTRRMRRWLATLDRYQWRTRTCCQASCRRRRTHGPSWRFASTNDRRWRGACDSHAPPGRCTVTATESFRSPRTPWELPLSKPSHQMPPLTRFRIRLRQDATERCWVCCTLQMHIYLSYTKIGVKLPWTELFKTWKTKTGLLSNAILWISILKMKCHMWKILQFSTFCRFLNWFG